MLMTSEDFTQGIDQMVASVESERDYDASSVSDYSNYDSRTWNVLQGTIRGKNGGGSEFTPAFSASVLNTAIISKHFTNRIDEPELPTNTYTTKIFIPFEYNFVGNVIHRTGGVYLLIGDPNFENKLARYINIQQDERVGISDIEKLMLLDKLPALDPFIIKERFQSINHSLDNNYVNISDEHFKNIKRSLVEEFKIIVKAIQGTGFANENSVSEINLRKQAAGLLDKIWNFNGGDELDALFHVIGVNRSDGIGLIQGWKGVLFYMHERNRMELIVDEIDLSLVEMKNKNLFNKYLIADYSNLIHSVREQSRQIIQKYEEARNEAFVKRTSATNMIYLLKHAEALYWILGRNICFMDFTREILREFFSSKQQDADKVYRVNSYFSVMKENFSIN